MIQTDVVLEALHALCHAGVTSAQRQRSESGLAPDISGGAGHLQQSMKEVTIRDLIPIALCGHTSSYSYSPIGGSVSSPPYQQQESLGGNQHLEGANQGRKHFFSLPNDIRKRGDGRIVLQPNYNWSKKHLDPQFDYDFTKLNDTEEYSRGDETYKRPCGWQRFALKVLDEFGDNTWLGNPARSTQSVPGEWPVSYHGTQERFVEAIIKENYKKGDGNVYGSGIYSTPDIKEAEFYAHEFTASSTNKKYKVIMQNRINPEYREICKRKEYWLIPIDEGTSEEKEKEIVHKAIRPYGILLKEV